MATNGTKEGWTRTELERFESLLLERRSELLGDLHAMEEAEAHDVPEASGVSTHLADLGSDRAASDLSLGRRASESVEIQEIDEAMERLRDGTFGICEDCEHPISNLRLQAIPYARLCLHCKEREEA